MKTLRLVMVLLFLLLGSAGTFAATDTIVDMNIFHVMGLLDDGEELSPSYMMGSQLGISFKSPNSSNVRGDVAISMVDSYSGTSWDPQFSIDRAYLRVRFPKFRITAGKTRIGWGDGAMFNAADLLFGSTNTDVTLTDKELRTATRWLTSATYPLGPFSFLEALVIAPEGPDFALRNTSFGGRYYTTISSTKVEIGGAYRADTSTTNDTGRVLSPYIALQGNFGPDWYVASSVNVAYPTEEIADELEDSWIISGGLLHIMNVGWQSTLSFRLEALVRPFGDWETSVEKNYGMYLYPEISFAPDDVWNFSIRSVVSPIDASANIMLGGSWNVMQGLSINGYATIYAGDDTDTFSWEQSNVQTPSGLSMMLGASWVY
ncbi:hypothetical protein [Pleomorphochaeta sp. DL1XJH-081]|uniref:hypothetical protein n=1 Tax=Pleomorphochaeta sp. DL1XJH-081 TaxID=3409690 RepID=UPI003BB79D35